MCPKGGATANVKFFRKPETEGPKMKLNRRKEKPEIRAGGGDQKVWRCSQEITKGGDVVSPQG